jgi:hypothetical protein
MGTVFAGAGQRGWQIHESGPDRRLGAQADAVN